MPVDSATPAGTPRPAPTERSRPNAPAQPRPDSKDKTWKAAKDFEAMFLAQSMQTMFSGVSTSGLGGGGFAEETWRGFLIQEYAQKASGAPGGIALRIYQDMKRLQEMQDGQPAAVERSTADGAVSPARQATAAVPPTTPPRS